MKFFSSARDKVKALRIPARALAIVLSVALLCAFIPFSTMAGAEEGTTITLKGFDEFQSFAIYDASLGSYSEVAGTDSASVFLKSDGSQEKVYFETFVLKFGSSKQVSFTVFQGNSGDVLLYCSDSNSLNANFKLGIAVAVNKEIASKKLNYTATGNSNSVNGEIDLEGSPDLYEGTMTLAYVSVFGTWGKLGKNVTISLSVPKPERKVDYTRSGEYTITDNSDKLIEPGSFVSTADDFVFNVNLTNISSHPEVKVQVGTEFIEVGSDLTVDEGQKEQGKYKYTLNKDKMTDNIFIFVTLNDNPGVTWNQVEGVTVYEKTPDISNRSVEYNSKCYKFAFNVEPGYDVTVRAFHGTSEEMDFYQFMWQNLGNGGTRVGYAFTRKNGALITSDIKIEITSKKKKLSVTLETGSDTTGYGVTGVGENVSYGDEFKFYVVPNPGYPDPTVTIKNTETSSPVGYIKDGNAYIISSLKENITVTITGSKKNEFSLNFESDTDGYRLLVYKSQGLDSLSSGTPVEHGTKITCFLVLKEGYTDSTNPQLVINSVSRPAIGHFGHTYVFEAFTVESATSISVSGVNKNVYNVILPSSGEGYNVTGSLSQNVAYGDPFSFTISLDAGYEPNVTGSEWKQIFQNEYPDVTVNFNGTTVTVSVSAVNCDMDFALKEEEPFKLKTFTVIQPGNLDEKKGYHIEFDGYSGLPMVAFSVGYGQSVSFDVVAKPGYRIDNVSATMAGNAVQLSNQAANGHSFVISNVTGNIAISVTATVIEYTVNYIYNPVTEFGYTFNYTHKGGSAVVYSVENDNSDKLDFEKGKLTLDEVDKPAGFTVKGWKLDNTQTVTEVSIDTDAKDQQFNVYADWELALNLEMDGHESSHDAFSLKHLDGGPKAENAGEGYRWTFRLELASALVDMMNGNNLLEKFSNFVKFSHEFEVVAVGFAYSPMDFSKQALLNLKGDIFGWTKGSDFLKGTATDNDSIFTTYVKVGRKGLNLSFTQHVFIPTNANCSGYVWFHLKHNGEDLLVLSDKISLRGDDSQS